MLHQFLNWLNRYLLDVLTISSMVLALVFFMHPFVTRSSFWRATVTPFASIIGSGFLIIAPFLWLLVANHGVTIMSITLVVAFMMGSIIRYNIRYSEPLIKKGGNKTIIAMHASSDIALCIAYFISIMFYLRLLSAFLLKGAGYESDLLATVVTSAILLFTGVYGKVRGFNFLESIEVYAVGIKLSVIVGLIVALLIYNIDVTHFQYGYVSNLNVDIEIIKKTAGMFLVVQGFETSRYLGHKYDRETRIKTMRFAQIFTSIIYLSFIYLSAFLMSDNVNVSETEIINITAKISAILPYVVIIGAIASQYSSSIADMIGCGSIIHDMSISRISLNNAYLIIAVFGLILIWFADIFELVAYASRAFALYYFLQCLLSLFVSEFIEGPKRHLFHGFVALVGSIMLFIFMFGEPIH